jgi:hypothetical protein
VPVQHIFLLVSRAATRLPSTAWRKYCPSSFWTAWHSDWSQSQFSAQCLYKKNSSNISTALVRPLALSWGPLIALNFSLSDVIVHVLPQKIVTDIRSIDRSSNSAHWNQNHCFRLCPKIHYHQNIKVYLSFHCYLTSLKYPWTRLTTWGHVYT